jgi:tetratricopeptide (TPR) repeat protein
MDKCVGRASLSSVTGQQRGNAVSVALLPATVPVVACGSMALHRKTFSLRTQRYARRLLLPTSLLTLAAGLLTVSAATPAHAEERAPKASAAAPLDNEFNAALKAGDEAYLAGRFAEAEQAYERAVRKQPENPAGYARLGAAQRQQGNLDGAIETLGKGLQTSTTVTERAKLIFLQADIRERQNVLRKATERWNAYLSNAGVGAPAAESENSDGERTIDLDAGTDTAAAASPIKGETLYPLSAQERLKQVAAAEKRVEDFEPVRARIKKREAAAEAKARRAK